MKCKGPMITGWLGVRAGEITRETEVIRYVGICLACGNRQQTTNDAYRIRHFAPSDWE